MKHKFLLIFISALYLSLSGCTSQETRPNNASQETPNQSLASQFRGKNLHAINYFIYRSDSIKAQPEFMGILFEEEEKKNMLQWLEKASEITVLTQKVKEILWFDFEYQIGKQVVDRKYLAYVQDENGRFYVKSFEVVKELNLEEFTEESIEPILQILGKDNWFVVEEAPF
ncbi:hypothetical protein [Brevibacillus borstelensis]|uniref:hypothetical protein n=1 Tax=Brevibacillus borstelensis TaxID=45462 RepID=UPI0030C5CFDB